MFSTAGVLVPCRLGLECYSGRSVLAACCCAVTVLLCLEASMLLQRIPVLFFLDTIFVFLAPFFCSVLVQAWIQRINPPPPPVALALEDKKEGAMRSVFSTPPPMT